MALIKYISPAKILFNTLHLTFPLIPVYTLILTPRQNKKKLMSFDWTERDLYESMRDKDDEEAIKNFCRMQRIGDYRTKVINVGWI